MKLRSFWFWSELVFLKVSEHWRNVESGRLSRVGCELALASFDLLSS